MNRLLLVVTLLGLVACSKEVPSMKNDMTVAPVGKGGGSDDGIKPIPRPTPVVGKGGIPDDGIKPVAKGGIPDDGIKPVAKGGVPDDGVKPVVIQKPQVPGVPDDGVKPVPRK